MRTVFFTHAASDRSIMKNRLVMISFLPVIAAPSPIIMNIIKFNAFLLVHDYVCVP